MFERYRLEPQPDGSYTLTLHLSRSLEEFARELGDDEKGEQTGLQKAVRRLAETRFPGLRITTAKVMLGTMLLTSLAVGGGGPAQAVDAAYSDIGTSYARQQIQELADRGVLAGSADGLFHPAAPMTRNEFAVLLARMTGLGPTPSGGKTYGDVADWAQGYVNAVVSRGYMSGLDPEHFGGSEVITREEMATVFVRALGLENLARVYNAQPTFDDGEKIAAYARPYVGFAQQIGFLQGSPNHDGTFSFDGKRPAERQEAALLAHKFHTDHDLYLEVGQDLAAVNAPRLHVRSPYITPRNEHEYLVEGTGKRGEFVTVTLTDGQTAVRATTDIALDGTFQLQLSAGGLRDGEAVILASYQDPEANRTRSASLAVRKDTQALPATLVPPKNITALNQLNYIVEGKAEPGAALHAFVTDGYNRTAHAEAKVDAQGNFTVAVDTRNLADGPVRVFVNAADAAGNLFLGAGTAVQVEKSTERPVSGENAPLYRIWGGDGVQELQH